MKSFGLVTFLLFGLTVSVCADASMERAKMVAASPYPLKTLIARVSGTEAKRSLTEKEVRYKHLLSAAEILKVETVYSHQNLSEVQDPQAIMNGISAKIYEDPSWDKSLEPSEVEKLSSLSTVVDSFGEKSYEWAWVLKQRGKRGAAKEILSQLYREGSESLLRMKMIQFDQNPLIKMEHIHRALTPLSSDSEKAQMEKRMQKMKTHMSHLPNSMMLT